MRTTTWLGAAAALLLVLPACAPKSKSEAPAALTKYAEVTLTADLSPLSEKERKMIPLLIDACQAMDEVFWLEAYGDRAALLEGIADPALRRHAEINYGPWDRLAGNRSFLPGVGPKPPGACFYPADMTKEEFERVAAASPDSLALRSLYTVVRRDGQKGLVAVPYHEAYAEFVRERVLDPLGMTRSLSTRCSVLTALVWR